MTPQEWEDLCDGCGKCCDIGNGIACPSLNCETKRCTVYENRANVEMCAKVTPKNVRLLHKRGVLPDTCAYVGYMMGEKVEPGTYSLIPFNMASPTEQAKYRERKRQHFAFLGK